MAPQPIECERWLGLYTDLLAGQRRLSAVMYQFRGALDQAYLQKLQTVALLNEVKRKAIPPVVRAHSPSASWATSSPR